MPFIGNQPALAYTSFAKQDFTTSATTSYTLDNPVTNANELALFINFVRQEPTTAYSASGTSLTLTSATSASDDMYCVFLGKAVQTVNPPNASVGISQLSATGTKNSTTFLRGDNTFNAPPLGGITMADQWRRTAAMTITSTAQVLSANWEQVDTSGQGTIGSSMTQSSGVFTFPSTGLYFITVNQNFYDNDTDSRYFEFKIDGTVNNSSYTTQSRMTSSLKYISSNTYSMLTCNTFFNVTNTSNCKIRFKAESQNDTTIGGDTAFNESQSYTFIRLGDSV